MTGDTNWTPYSVPELAGILDDDLSSAWEQVGAWFSADAMLDDAAGKLADARTGLAAVWPPESSPAAQTFFQVVDALTDSMKKTALAANTNANALSQVLENHTDTKSKVDGLHSAWTANQKLAPVNPDEFPATTPWQSGLNSEAQQHMTAADNVINEYASTLVVPPLIPVPGWFDQTTVIPGSDGTPVATGGGSAPGARSPGGGIAVPTGGGPRPPGGSVPPLPGVPILTGGVPPPSGGGPGRLPPGSGPPGFPTPPSGPTGPGAPGGPGGPGIRIPVIPGPPGTGGSTPVGGLAPGEPGGTIPGEPGVGGAAGGVPGKPGGGASPGRPGGSVGFPGESGFPGEGVTGTGLNGIGGGLAGAGAAGLPPGEVLPGRRPVGGPPAEPLPGFAAAAGGSAGGISSGGPGEAGLGFMGGAPIGGGGGAAPSRPGVGTGRFPPPGFGSDENGLAGGVFGDVVATDGGSARGTNVLGRDGTLRPSARSSTEAWSASKPGDATIGDPSLARSDFADSVGPSADDATLRPRPASLAYVDGPGAGATLAPAEPVTGSARGASGEGTPAVVGGATGSGGRRRTRRSVADVTWVMPAGGPAVLIPESEHEVHDPGPGVIGIDR